MNILEDIVLNKIDYLKVKKKVVSDYDIKKAASRAKSKPSFKNAMAKKGLSIIGEIKKASPSKGIIDNEFAYMDIAKEYNMCMDAISVLTETDYFLGNPDYLREIAGMVDIPVLMKDFIIDSYQIYEGKALGASCILLIASLLDSEKLKSYIELCISIGMDSLVEIHNEVELYRALKAGAGIIGINNRNLKDFSVDINKTVKLGALIPDSILCISESGILSKKDAAFIKKTRADAILVGEYFMKSNDKKYLAEELRNA